jgi:hypothetical protein
MNEADAWKRYERIKWLGFVCFGTALVVFPVSLLASAGGSSAGPVSAATSSFGIVMGALLVFLWALTCLIYLALLVGFQCLAAGSFTLLFTDARYLG